MGGDKLAMALDDIIKTQKSGAPKGGRRSASQARPNRPTLKKLHGGSPSKDVRRPASTSKAPRGGNNRVSRENRPLPTNRQPASRVNKRDARPPLRRPLSRTPPRAPQDITSRRERQNFEITIVNDRAMELDSSAVAPRRGASMDVHPRTASVPRYAPPRSAFGAALEPPAPSHAYPSLTIRKP